MDKQSYITEEEIDIPIYGGKLVLVLTNDFKALDKKYPNHELDDNNMMGCYWNEFDGKYSKFFISFNPEREWERICHGNIAHESGHLVNSIAKYRGIILDPDNDEPIAYLLEWCVNKIYKFLKDRNIEVHYAN